MSGYTKFEMGFHIFYIGGGWNCYSLHHERFLDF